MIFKTEKELLDYTENIKGKTFKEIDSKHLLDGASLTRRKGLLGQVVETGFYDYPINSDSKADFEELGIELKVTGYVKNKNGSLRAKERLKLSTIDFNKIVNETFETSHVLEKCEKMLIIWYEYDKEKEASDFLITHYQLYDMSRDKEIFSNDFKIIKGKVLAGKAHELSEGDTSYLGACTNAQTSSDRTTQPFSDIRPKPRAYSLKNAYMTGILRESTTHQTLLTFESETPSEFGTVIEYDNDKLNPHFGKTHVKIHEEITEKKYNDKIPKNTTTLISDELIGKDNELPKQELSEGVTPHLEDYTNVQTPSYRTTQPFLDIRPKQKSYSPTALPFESSPKHEFRTVIEYVSDKLNPYFGKTQVEILEDITGKKYEDKIPKNINKMISDELIGKDNELPKKHELFAKTNFIIKNLPVQENGKPRERMSFKTISLSDFDENWEDSYWKSYFEEVNIITICYAEKNKSRNGFRILTDVKQITFDDEDLDSFEKTYTQIKLAIEKEDVKLLPTSTNGFKNQMLEIAPKGIKGDDAYVNFFKRDKTKVAFMISKKLLIKKLK